jgi:DNA-binding response OmpR family regulator
MNTNRQKVLVVEDDPAIREGLVVTLQSEGYEVADVDNGSDALRAVAEHDPDLVLLDIMLPGRNGYDVCRDLRRERAALPIIMLTAKGEEIDKVIGLELGADDYVTKPFGVRELLARIGAVLRRTARLQPTADPDYAEPFTFGSAHIDPAAMRGSLGDRSFDLTPRELRLLEYFHDRPGMVLSRDKILHDVWDYEYVGTTRTLDQHIAMLRKKIECDPRNPQSITTVHGAGYRYEGD